MTGTALVVAATDPTHCTMTLLRPFLALFVALLLTLAPASAQELRAAPEAVPAIDFHVEEPPDWVTVPGIVADVHGDADRHKTLTALARHAATSAPQLAEELGLPLGSKIEVYVAENEKQFHALQPGAPPDWADGTAYPRAGRIYLRRPGIRGPDATPLNMVLDHEIIHVLVGRAFAPNEPPRWLQEGLAKVYAGEHSPDTVAQIARSLFDRDLFTLEELSNGFPLDAGGAQLAYAQSSDLISYLRAEYGEESVRTLTREMAAGASVHKAVRSATGLWLDDLDKQWRRELDSGPGPLWLTGFLAKDGFWFLMSALAVVAFLVGYRRRRRQMADYAEDERQRDALLWSLLQPRQMDSDHVH